MNILTYGLIAAGDRFERFGTADNKFFGESRSQIIDGSDSLRPVEGVETADAAAAQGRHSLLDILEKLVKKADLPVTIRIGNWTEADIAVSVEQQLFDDRLRHAERHRVLQRSTIDRRRGLVVEFHQLKSRMIERGIQRDRTGVVGYHRPP